MLRLLISVFGVLAAGWFFAVAGATADESRIPPMILAQAAPKAGTLPQILPPGKGQSLLLENCSSCHSAVCAVKGQRPAGRWAGLKEDHKDKVTGLSDADMNTLFAYLVENFNDTRPEPKLPPELAQQGSCTPY
jgi:mono/diheme cytochrome c family protein